MLAFSFVSLAAFGSYLMVISQTSWRLTLLVPLGLESIWVIGLLLLRGHYSTPILWAIADNWTRYSLAIPAALLASIGLIVQQRVFRRAGLVSFGRDALWAAIAFAWYGLVGQLFVPTLTAASIQHNKRGTFHSFIGYSRSSLSCLDGHGSRFFCYPLPEGFSGRNG